MLAASSSRAAGPGAARAYAVRLGHVVIVLVQEEAAGPLYGRFGPFFATGPFLALGPFFPFGPILARFAFAAGPFPAAFAGLFPLLFPLLGLAVFFLVAAAFGLPVAAFAASAAPGAALALGPVAVAGFLLAPRVVGALPGR